MAVKNLQCQIVGAWDGRVLKCVDDHGAAFNFEPDSESQPTVAVWGKGDLVRFKKFDLSSEYSWRGIRGNARDSALFRMVI